jgi:RNA polymerase sigma factor (TIGR02999 family)
MTPSSPNVTQLLRKWSRGGDREALDQLLPVVYTELHKQAARYLRKERVGHTLQPTALVHEAYLRLIGQTEVDWQNRAHFFGIAAQLMRRILVDHARDRHAEKRGGPGAVRVTLDELVVATEGSGVDLLALDEALTRLSAMDGRQARVVELRFFSGLNVEETAEVMDISPSTVKLDWRMAKAWLRQEMK